MCGDIFEPPSKKRKFKAKINRETLCKLRKYYNDYLLGVELINQVSAKVALKYLLLKESNNHTSLPAAVRNLTIKEVESSYFSEGTVEIEFPNFLRVNVQVYNSNKI